MLNCRNCKNGSYSGGQEELAEKQNRRVETMSYLYCNQAHDHVYIKPAAECKTFTPKENVPAK